MTALGLSHAPSLGRYELLLELARGGMAELFLGRLHGAGGFAKLVAIKRILPHLAADRQFTEMFLNEGRIAAQLSHPNVCQVFELGEADGAPFLAMEYLRGVAWEQLSEAAPREAALALAAGVLGQAAEGLHYAHTLRDARGSETPVIHRDVSPQNLFVTVDGVCKVLDFGVSKMMTDGPRTRSGVIKGKLPYMAPEQIRGEEVSARTDVFSLGVCAWEALAGARLFDRGTDFQIWKAITEEEVPPIASRWPACPPLVEAVVQRALSRDPGSRQATARGFADELRNAAGGAASASELAAAVRRWCGERLEDVARRVAAAVSGDGGAAMGAADREGGGMQLRRGSLAVQRDGGDAGAEDAAPTRDFAASASNAQPDDAAPTRDFAASASNAQPDDAAPTRDFAASAPMPGVPAVPYAPSQLHGPPPGWAGHAPPTPPRPPARRRGHLVTALVAGGAAAAITAVVVILLVRGDRSPTSEPPAPTEREPSEAPHAWGLDQIPKMRRDLTRLRDSLAPLQEISAAAADMGAAAPEAAAANPAPADDGSAAEPGVLILDSKPAATIFEGEQLIGITPLRVQLPPGPHQLRAVLHKGRRERTLSVEIEPGKDTTVDTLTW